jgi:hypothetical protein
MLEKPKLPWSQSSQPEESWHSLRTMREETVRVAAARVEGSNWMQAVQKVQRVQSSRA